MLSTEISRPRRRNALFRATLAVLLALPAIRVCHAQYTPWIDLGTPAGRNSIAYGINAAGQIVGHSEAGGERYAFLWDANAGWQEMGTLGGTWSGATAINASGQVVGYSPTPNGYRGFLWDAVNGMRDIGAGLGGSQSQALAINAAGQIVGVATIRNNWQWHGFIYDTVTGWRDLGSLGGDGCWPLGINASGQVVGYSNTATGRRRAFLWDPVNGMRDLGTLGGNDSQAYAINDAGQVVGQAHTASGYAHAFLWDPVHGMRDLGTLGGVASGAHGINAMGQVVGWSYTGRFAPSDNARHAFIWDPARGMRDLGDPQTTEETFAYNINDLGQVIGLVNLPGGVQHACLWNPLNSPPVADAGPDQIVEATGSATRATLDASGSTDPDNDPLTYSWYEGATALGEGNPCIVDLPPGTHTLRLIVSDPSGETSEDEVVVTIVDTTAPSIGALTDVSVDESDPSGTPLPLTPPSVIDLVDPNPVLTSDAPARFPLGVTTVTWTARDASGNVRTAQQRVTVVPGSPGNQLANLDKLILQLVASGEVSAQASGSLLAKVDAAEAALSQGNANAAKVAMNDLKALVNYVEAQSGNQITAAAAALIIQRANQIIAALGG